MSWEDTSPGACRACGEAIRWVRFPVSGKKMPVDADPSAGGTVVVDMDGDARKLGRAEEYGGDKYVSHFETCPNAKDFRRPK